MLNFTVLSGSHARVRSQQSRRAALRAAKSGLLTHRRAGEREKHAAHLRHVTVSSGSHARVRSQQSRQAALRAARPDSANAQTRGKPDGFPRVCLSQRRPERAREPAAPAPSARHPRSSSTPALRWRRLPAHSASAHCTPWRASCRVRRFHRAAPRPPPSVPCRPALSPWNAAWRTAPRCSRTLSTPQCPPPSPKRRPRARPAGPFRARPLSRPC